MSRILLVDDDRDLLNVAMKFLGKEELNFKVTTVISARKAVQKLATESYDAIVCDYQMPEITGLELLEQLRAAGNDIPFIIFTGRGREEVAMRALNLGADYYLLKGGSPKALYGELAHIINQLVHHYRTEHALNETRTRAQKYLDIAGVMIVALDADGTVNSINQKGCEVLGYPEEEIVGKNWFHSFLPERVRETIRSIFTKLMAGEVEGVKYAENAVLTATGEERIIAWHNTILTEDDKLIGTLSSGEDITEQKQAEQALRKSEREKAFILESTSDAIIYKNRDLRIVWANEAASNAFGLPSNEMVGKFCYEVRYKRSEPCIDCPCIKAFEKEEREHREYTGPEGEIWDERAYPVREESGAIIGAVSVATKITAQKEMENALRESETRFRLAFENANIGMCLVDTNGGLMKVNRRMSEMFGYSQAELESMTVNDIAHPDDLDISPRFIERSTAGEIDHTVFEKRYRHKQGQVVWGEVASSLVRDSQAEPLYFISHVRDITEQKQAEEALRENESRYRALLERANDGIAIIQDELILFVNQRLASMLDYPANELINNHFGNYLHPDRLTELTDLYRRRMAGETVPSTYDTIIRRRDGSYLDMELNTGLIVYQGHPADLVILRDISERKQAEEALRESEARYRDLVEFSPVAIFVHRQGKFLYLNPAAIKLHGAQSADDFRDKTLFDFVHPDYKPILQQRVTQAVSDPDKERFTYLKIIRLDGKVIDLQVAARRFNYHGEPASLIFCIDITEREEIEAALRESEARSHALLSAIPDLMFRLSKDGEFLSYKGGTEELYVSPTLFLGKKVSEVLPAEVAQITMHKIEMALQTGQMQVYEYSLPIKGRLRHYESRMVPCGEEGEVLAIIRDITNQKHAEQQLKQQKEELSEFAHAMAHDLKNNLLSIEGYADLLQTEYDAAYADKIAQLAQGMNEFLRHSIILADAGLVVEKTEDVNLTKVVRSTAEAIIPVHITFRHDPLPLVAGDREKLVQIFQNLFENAMIHGQPNVIEVKRVDTEDGVKIAVSNDGELIPSEITTEVFRRGFSTKEDGLGLGLTIVQKAIEAHGWQISLEAFPKTTFQIFIPSEEKSSASREL